MTGVDATDAVIQRGQARCQQEGLADRIRFVKADVCDSGLPDCSADFIWGEDAWCYVVDKERLIAEAARIVRPGGVIAFTDWIEGSAGLTLEEASRYLRFMKFPSVQDLDGYRQLLAHNRCDVLLAEDTGRFPAYVDLYLNMLESQLTYDALRIIGFDSALMQSLGGEMSFLRELARGNKIAQGILVARKRD
jgi:SAM-dependent methyltransferase